MKDPTHGIAGRSGVFLQAWECEIFDKYSQMVSAHYKGELGCIKMRGVLPFQDSFCGEYIPTHR